MEPENLKSLVCRPIVVKRGASVGEAATILPEVTIGDNAVVAAAAIVTKDVPANTIVAGVPAIPIKRLK